MKITLNGTEYKGPFKFQMPERDRFMVFDSEGHPLTGEEIETFLNSLVPTTGEGGGLLPCPFCGDIQNQHVDELLTNVVTVLCGNQACCSQGPLACDERSAITAWNKREADSALCAALQARLDSMECGR